MIPLGGAGHSTQWSPGFLILVFVVWFFASIAAATHTLNGGTPPAGLLERPLSIIGCCWLSLLALQLMSKKTPKKD